MYTAHRGRWLIFSVLYTICVCMIHVYGDSDHVYDTSGSRAMNLASVVDHLVHRHRVKRAAGDTTMLARDTATMGTDVPITRAVPASGDPCSNGTHLTYLDGTCWSRTELQVSAIDD